MDLSPTQLKIKQDIISVITQSKYKTNIIVIIGDKGIGKDKIISHLIEEKYTTSDKFNLRITDILPPGGKNRITCRDLGLSLDKLYTQLIEKPNNILRISHLDEFYDVLEDVYSDNRKLTHILFRNFFTRLADKQIILLISSRHLYTYELSNVWNIKYKISDIDTEYFIKRHVDDDSIVRDIMGINKIQAPWAINQIFNYIKDVSNNEISNLYKSIYTKLNQSNVNIKEEIPHIDPKCDLLGLENILEELDISILEPLSRNNLDIWPMKRGIIIHGPPGTGKSSIGRYLAQKLQDKFFLLGSGDAMRSFVDSLEYILSKAEKNAPSVLFIDDIDFVLSNDDICRSLLTLLDGVNNKNRNKVSIIITAMDINKVPAALLRGKRLELVLETNYPNSGIIEQLVKEEYQKIKNAVKQLYGKELDNYNIKGIISKLSGWNHADIRRVMEDIHRHILYKINKNDVIVLDKLISEIIHKIQLQKNKIRELLNNNVGNNNYIYN